MKKLLVAATVVCIAVVSQAAVANWKAQAANIYDGTGSTGSKYTGTAYFFDSAKQTQQSLYSLICGADSFDATKATGYVASGDVSAGAISSTATVFSYGEQSESASNKNYYNFYFVLIEDGKAYFSAEKRVGANATTTAATVSYGSLTTGSQTAPVSGAGFQGAGLWSETVPEPTSGLLMLLGFAGLALRRKQK